MDDGRGPAGVRLSVWSRYLDRRLASRHGQSRDDDWHARGARPLAGQRSRRLARRTAGKNAASGGARAAGDAQRESTRSLLRFDYDVRVLSSDRVRVMALDW